MESVRPQARPQSPSICSANLRTKTDQLCIEVSERGKGATRSEPFVLKPLFSHSGTVCGSPFWPFCRVTLGSVKNSGSGYHSFTRRLTCSRQYVCNARARAHARSTRTRTRTLTNTAPRNLGRRRYRKGLVFAVDLKHVADSGHHPELPHKL
jgi:hypothetical protein